MTDIALIIAIIFAVTFIITGFSIAPWVPSRKNDLDRINKLANLKPGDIFYELGSGDGRVSIHLAKNNPHTQIIGIEMSIPLFIVSRIKQLFLRLPNLKIKFGNALHHDLSQANVIYTFAMIESINSKLKSKFLNELQKGSRILSYIFSIKKWPGQSHTDKPTPTSQTIHVYQV